MFAAAIDQSSDGTAVNYVDAAALQGETLIGEILDGRRKIKLAVEPGFYGVLIGRDNIDEMAGLERAQMSVDNFGRKDGFIVAGAARGGHSPGGENNENQRSGYRQPLPGGATGEDSDPGCRTDILEDFLAKRYGRFFV